MNGPLAEMNGPLAAVNGPLVAMNGPPAAMSGPRVAMSGPLDAMSGPLAAMNGQLTAMSGPLDAMSGPLTASSLVIMEICDWGEGDGAIQNNLSDIMTVYSQRAPFSTFSSSLKTFAQHNVIDWTRYGLFASGLTKTGWRIVPKNRVLSTKTTLARTLDMVSEIHASTQVQAPRCVHECYDDQRSGCSGGV